MHRDEELAAAGVDYVGLQKRVPARRARAQHRPGAFLAVEVAYDDDSHTPARFVYLVAGNGVLHYERFDDRHATWFSDHS